MTNEFILGDHILNCYDLSDLSIDNRRINLTLIGLIYRAQFLFQDAYSIYLWMGGSKLSYIAVC